MSSPGRSFGGVADYCLHDPRMPGEAHHPESAERVDRDPQPAGGPRSLAPGVAPLHPGRSGESALLRPSEADPDRGFMARMMALCSL